MLSARTVFDEVIDDDEAFRFFCSIAASGEAQGGWENGRGGSVTLLLARALRRVRDGGNTLLQIKISRLVGHGARRQLARWTRDPGCGQ